MLVEGLVSLSHPGQTHCSDPVVVNVSPHGSIQIPSLYLGWELSAVEV